MGKQPNINKKWKEYLTEFEKKILIPIYESELVKIEPVPLRSGKIHTTHFGNFVGKCFEYEKVLSFNYYGLFKPSAGLLLTSPEPGRNTINAPTIHFSSVKIEHIEGYQKDLLLEFVRFKKFLVALRWKK